MSATLVKQDLKQIENILAQMYLNMIDMKNILQNIERDIHNGLYTHG